MKMLLMLLFLVTTLCLTLNLSRLQMGWSRGAMMSTPNIAPQFRPILGVSNPSELRRIPACSSDCIVETGFRCAAGEWVLENACLAHHRYYVVLNSRACLWDRNFLFYHTMDNELRKVAINFLQELDNDRFSKFYFKELAAKYRRFSRQPGNRNR